jgi:hypothetical protein
MLNSACYPIFPLQLCRTKKEGKGKDMCANLIVTSKYPPDKTLEMAKVFVKVYKTLPKVLKPIGECPFICPTETGYMSVDIYEIDDAKLGEAMKELATYMNNYALSVPGYQWKVEPVLKAREALALVGIQAPTR